MSSVCFITSRRVQTFFELCRANSTSVYGFRINQSAESREGRMFTLRQIEILRKHQSDVWRRNYLAFRSQFGANEEFLIASLHHYSVACSNFFLNTEMMKKYQQILFFAASHSRSWCNFVHKVTKLFVYLCYSRFEARLARWVPN
jgi:hypothetical protein